MGRRRGHRRRCERQHPIHRAAPFVHELEFGGKHRSVIGKRQKNSQFLAGGVYRAATSPSSWSGRNRPFWTAVVPLYAVRFVAAPRVPPQADTALSNNDAPEAARRLGHRCAWQRCIRTLNRTMQAAGVTNPRVSRIKRKPRTVQPTSKRDGQPPSGKPWLAVRKGKVARARRLLEDPNYPPPKVLDSVARLLARHLRPRD
jgi:hypothetical protein